MPLYDYKIKDKNGKLVKGRIMIDDREKLLGRFQKEGATPIEINEAGEKAPSKLTELSDKLPLSMGNTVSEEEKAFFTRQFTTMLKAGLSMDRILNILYRQAKSRKLKDVLYSLAVDLQKGASIKDAMNKHPEVFDNMYTSMVAVGEKTGNLQPIFGRLSDMIEKKLSITKKVRSAMAYPAFILVFSSILAYVLLTVFLPGFIPMFKSIGVNVAKDYPLTGFLIALSKTATNWKEMLFVIALVVAVIAGIKVFYNSPAGKRFFDSFLLMIPGFNALIKQSAVTRICRSLAYLTKSGVPLLQALGIVSQGAGNVLISHSVDRIANYVNEGESLSGAIEKEPIFPDVVTQLVRVGEESGELSEMLEKTADYLDEGVDNTVTAVVSLMEPSMMICVGCVVGVFITGILMPIFDLTSKLAN